MSTRRIRRRLDRLEKSIGRTIQIREPTSDFIIDPVLAKAILEARRRLDELQKASGNSDLFGDFSATEEERALLEHIAEKASMISCPPSYGFGEMWDDIRGSKEWRFVGVARTSLSEADEAQRAARIAAFKQTPEWRARSSIRELMNIDWPTAEEEDELDRLIALYPEGTIDPKEPCINSLIAVKHAIIKYAKESRKEVKLRRAKIKSSQE